MRCLVCDGVEWENVDEFRIKPQGMSACRSCGFISYPEKYKTKEAVLEYYRHGSYRKGPPNATAIYSGERKLHFHNEFLKNVYQEWKDKKNDRPVICDVGAAFGMVPHMFKRMYPKSTAIGVELTEIYRRVAFNEYGVELTEEFDDSIKYDLIISYKSAEHIFDADIEIRKWITSLKPDGYLYIGVPIWFDILHNFGIGGYDIEYYYHPDHVNTWSEAHFRAVLAKCGCEVVAMNNTMYDYAFLVKRNDSLMQQPRELPTVASIKEKLASVKLATDHFIKSEFEQAFKAYKNFPSAILNWYERNRNFWHQQGFEAIVDNVINVALESCPDNPEVHIFAADLAMRYDNFELAVQFLDKTLKLSPANVQALEKMIVCFGQMAEVEEDKDRKINLLQNARRLAHFMASSSMQFKELGINFSLKFSAMLPIGVNT